MITYKLSRKRFFSIAITLLLAANSLFSGLLASAEADNTATAAEDTESGNIYALYAEKYRDISKPDSEIDLFNYDLNNETALSTSESYKTEFSAKETGLYAIDIAYMLLNGSEAPAVSVRIDGELPYYEASGIKLPSAFKDDGIDWSNTPDEYTIPEQTFISEYREYTLFDTAGYYGGMLYFYIEKGSHSFELLCESGEFKFNSLKFTNSNLSEPYDKSNLKSGYKDYDGDALYFEAENMQKKSDSSIYPINDFSSASVSPQSYCKKYLNTVGGSSFENAGQYIEWEFTVPKDALYIISIKYRQSENTGMNSYRRILIDGKVPYSELEEYAFPYSGGYKNLTLSADGEPIKFALEKGVHTIRLQVVIGGLKDYLPHINTIAEGLSDCYRKIIMITGTNPDSIRDYNLDSSIPETLEQLKSYGEELGSLKQAIERVSGAASSGSKAIGNLYEQIKEFNKDSYNITKNLALFKTNISSLYTWLLEAKTQPLKLDYFTLSSSQADIKSAKAGILQGAGFLFKSFIYTFSSDYEQNTITSNDANTITVWVSTGATQYRIIQQLISADFEKKNPNIRVILRNVNENMATALIAKKAPDIKIGVPEATVMNYAYRNALVDISEFKDCGEVLSVFRDTALTPLSYGGAVYAVPETQTFPAMFYRTDIFNEMGLKAPETWKDVISVLSKLKKNNLEFGIPKDPPTFFSILYQFGGSLYNKDFTATNLYTYSAIEAFTLYTGFFTDYSAPLSYNALNRFRTGEMPVFLAEFNYCNTLEVLAPEINGKWDMALYPGTAADDGSVDHSAHSTVTGNIIINKDKKEQAWTFLKWWASEEVQINRSERYEMALGRSERTAAANRNAYLNLGWSDKAENLIKESEKYIFSYPNVPGSYFLTRHINNAIADVIYNDAVPGDALRQYAGIIDKEITYKRTEFGLD